MYLIIADYFSKFPLIRKMPHECTSRAVINATRQVFAEQGVPEKIISHNGRHFDSSAYMHYEPPGQNVSIVSQICLIFVSNCLKRSQFCLKHVSDKMSQFGLNLRPF